MKVSVSQMARWPSFIVIIPLVIARAALVPARAVTIRVVVARTTLTPTFVVVSILVVTAASVDNWGGAETRSDARHFV